MVGLGQLLVYLQRLIIRRLGIARHLPVCARVRSPPELPFASPRLSDVQDDIMVFDSLGLKLWGDVVISLYHTLGKTSTSCHLNIRV